MSFLSVNGQPRLQTYSETWHAWAQARPTKVSTGACIGVLKLFILLHIYTLIFLRVSGNHSMSIKPDIQTQINAVGSNGLNDLQSYYHLIKPQPRCHTLHVLFH